MDILADYMISSISYKSLIWYHISGLYDIEQNIPINYNLVTHKNERKALIEQLVHYKGDILVLDRGYYSSELVNILEEKEINYVFRLSKTIGIVKDLVSQNKNYSETYIIYNKW